MGLATAQSGTAGGGLADMRRGVELVREQNVLPFDGLLMIALAEAEAHAGDVDRALAILDEALATSERTGHRTFDAELHRVRGEMLLKRDPASPRRPRKPSRPPSPSPNNKGRAVSNCARLLPRQALSIDRSPRRSSRRPRARARRLLADARNAGDRRGAGAARDAGGDDEVKAATERHRRRLDLQTSYGQALIGREASRQKRPRRRSLASMKLSGLPKT